MKFKLRPYELVTLLAIAGLAYLTYIIFVVLGIPENMSVFDLTGYWIIVALAFSTVVVAVLDRSEKKLCQKTSTVITLIVGGSLALAFFIALPEVVKRVVLVNADPFPEFLVTDSIKGQVYEPFVDGEGSFVSAGPECGALLLKKKVNGLFAQCEDGKVYRVVVPE